MHAELHHVKRGAKGTLTIHFDGANDAYILPYKICAEYRTADVVQTVASLSLSTAIWVVYMLCLLPVAMFCCGFW